MCYCVTCPSAPGWLYSRQYQATQPLSSNWLSFSDSMTCKGLIVNIKLKLQQWEDIKNKSSELIKVKHVNWSTCLTYLKIIYQRYMHYLSNNIASLNSSKWDIVLKIMLIYLIGVVICHAKGPVDFSSPNLNPSIFTFLSFTCSRRLCTCCCTWLASFCCEVENLWFTLRAVAARDWRADLGACDPCPRDTNPGLLGGAPVSQIFKYKIYLHNLSTYSLSSGICMNKETKYVITRRSINGW